ncbi:BolA family protein [Methylogaea oryzae]|uniref:BolA family transcriptional regulator n=1 Tax=Methylogaea oryzae TaxID=1295382 RepID=A0A8D4VQV7_9GAMM|nr:BolA/IbaG family iron-sulfur metabolism protein [Methylogaea oryzae]BBL72052.1 BolA family transcriptional regulator [Methylogaea oryzae]
MDVADVRNLIEAALPDCRVAVEGEGCNFSCVVVSPGFQALGSLQRQRLVLAALQAPLASGALHAITVKAYTPEEWEPLRSAAAAELVRLQ